MVARQHGQVDGPALSERSESKGVANLSAGLIVSTNQNLAARVFVSSLNGPGDP